MPTHKEVKMKWTKLLKRQGISREEKENYKKMESKETCKH